MFDTDYATFRKAAILKDVKVLAEAWRPGYKFTETPPLSPTTGKPGTRALGSGPDAALDQAGREAVIESFFAPAFELELELELIQTQMAQKPMLRAKVYAHAIRASQNRKKEVRREKEV